METTIKNASDAFIISEQNSRLDIDSILNQIEVVAKCGDHDYRVAVSGNQVLDNLIISLVNLGFSCKRIETPFGDKFLTIEW